MTYAPAALVWFGREMVVRVGGQFSGIVGDLAHGGRCYHASRNQNPPGQYCVTLPLDREGDGEAASAVDWNLPDNLMSVVTQRLINAAEHPEDDRLDVLREFYGTTDGYNVVGRSHNGYGQAWSFVSSDNSHLWHIHLSFFRKHSNDTAGAEKVLSVVTGESWVAYKARVAAGVPPVTPPTSLPPAPAGTPAFPLPVGHYFGDLNGPNESHGGFYGTEPDHSNILKIQLRLITLGYAGTTDLSWADGKYEQATIDAVKRMQGSNGLQADGKVGPASWARLFSGAGSTNPVPTVPPSPSTVKLRVLPGVNVDDFGKKMILYLERVLPDALLSRMYVTSNFRPTNDYHGAQDDKGALDYSSVMTGQGAIDRRDAALIVYADSGNWIEMIHTTPFDTDNGFYVKWYQRQGPGYYGSATEAAHVDHIHNAASTGDVAAATAKHPAKAAPAPSPIPMPTPVPTPTPAPIPGPTPGALAATYTVRTGDTLSGIARKFGVKVPSILKYNPAITDPNVIRVGQVIKLLP